MQKYPTIPAVVEPCVDAYVALGKQGTPAAIVASGCIHQLIKVCTYLLSRNVASACDVDAQRWALSVMLLYDSVLIGF